MIRSGEPALVIDASVAIALSVEEPLADSADRILRTRRTSGGRLLVPSFFWLEVVNVLTMRYRLSPDRVLEAIVALEDLSLETVELDRPQLLLALDVMARSGLPACDAAYVALAEAADALLLTADQRMASVAGVRALPLHGGHAVEEARESHGPSWAAWPGAAAYLRKLRTQVAGEARASGSPRP